MLFYYLSTWINTLSHPYQTHLSSTSLWPSLLLTPGGMKFSQKQFWRRERTKYISKYIFKIHFKNIALQKQMIFFLNSYYIRCEMWIWELDYKESWAPKNWCFWTVVLEKTLESPLEFKEIQPVHPKINQSWIFIGRTDVEAETPVLWPPDVKSWLIWKDPDAGKDWGREEKGSTEDEMVGWHHWLNGHEFE